MAKVTAVLITWKRQHNLPRIIEEILKVPQINEILIHDNSKGENRACYRRFELAVKAKNETIYTQDDDCVNHDISELIGEFGNLTCGATKGYIDALDKPPYLNTNLALLGFGSLFKKAWIDFSKYKYPHDDLFYREADRIFTLGLEKRPKIVKCNIELLDEDTEAMSQQPNHIEDRKIIIERMT